MAWESSKIFTKAVYDRVDVDESVFPVNTSSRSRNTGIIEMKTLPLGTGYIGSNPARGQCYGHNFLRFSQIFGEKIDVFL
jgi:hypothetical protein